MGQKVRALQASRCAVGQLLIPKRSWQLASRFLSPRCWNRCPSAAGSCGGNSLQKTSSHCFWKDKLCFLFFALSMSSTAYRNGKAGLTGLAVHEPCVSGKEHACRAPLLKKKKGNLKLPPCQTRGAGSPLQPKLSSFLSHCCRSQPYC